MKWLVWWTTDEDEPDCVKVEAPTKDEAADVAFFDYGVDIVDYIEECDDKD